MKLTELKSLPEDNWRDRALEATAGNQSLLGAILLGAIGQGLDHELVAGDPPRFRGKASVSSDGYVFCEFQSKDGRWHHSALVCDVEDLVGNMRGLADHLKLSDSDRREFFRTIRNWIGKDWRINPHAEFNDPVAQRRACNAASQDVN